MEPTSDFKSLQDHVQKSLVSIVKTANRIAAEDLAFQRTVNPDVAEQLDDKSARLLGLSSRLLKSAADACGLPVPSLEDIEDIDLNWRGLVDVVDTALEKADTALDEYTGLIKRKEPPTDTVSDPKKQKPAAKVVRNANISKPQVHFDVQPNNFPDDPWKPIITDKPHSEIPLEKSLVTFTGANGSSQYKHPYETEIARMDYPTRVFEHSEPIPFQPMDKTQATWVDTFEGVLDMLQHLKRASEIAVDLEHHDFRTYTGLVCLMQISTRERDFIVDTLKPWRHKLEVLNTVFANPAIVKVFHGAYMDMIWLQRDLGLYVNGLFDTYFACDLLGYPGRGLAYLLSTFAGFTADKQYQLADWRMRPIPPEMLYYARSDTHYLLYIYDRVRNELIASSDRSNPETDLIGRALEKSKEVSLYRHEHPEFNEATGEGSRGWFNYVLKNGHLAFDSEQFAIFRALWKWRDTTARREDENPNFVLSSSTIGQVARVNPPDIKALHSLLPMSPPIARACLKEIWEEIRKAKSEDGPTLLHYLTSLAPDALRKNGKIRAPASQSSSLPLMDGEVAVQRLPRSQLFGSMPISSRWEEPKKTVDNAKGDNVPFPWQRFVQETSEGGDTKTKESLSDTTDSQQPSDAVVAPAADIYEEPDEEFTLKRGKKRKAAPDEEDKSSREESGDTESDLDEDQSMPDATDDGMLALDDEKPMRRKPQKEARKAEKRANAQQQQQQQQQQQAKDRRMQKKAERKAQKAQRKQEKKDKRDKEDRGNKEKEQAKYNMVPFNYSKAASEMSASRDGPGDGQKKKVADPYVKTLEEGVKGARKAPPIRGERSATFKK